eukprot:216165-Lingulodinium_polyedra.AAC.1
MGGRWGPVALGALSGLAADGRTHGFRAYGAPPPNLSRSLMLAISATLVEGEADLVASALQPTHAVFMAAAGA